MGLDIDLGMDMLDASFIPSHRIGCSVSIAPATARVAASMIHDVARIMTLLFVLMLQLITNQSAIPVMIIVRG